MRVNVNVTSPCQCGEWNDANNDNISDVIVESTVVNSEGTITVTTADIPVTMEPGYQCQGNCSSITYKWHVTGPNGFIALSTVPVSAPIELTQSELGGGLGNYVVTLKSYCDGQACDKFRFNLVIESECPDGCKCLTPEQAPDNYYLCNNENISCELQNGDEGLCFEPCEKITKNFPVCKCDNFTGDSESSNPSQALINWIDANYNPNNGYYNPPNSNGHSRLKNCDDATDNRYWAHSFTNLSISGHLCEIQSAILEVHVHNDHSNDKIHVGFITNPNSGWSAWAFSQPLTNLGVPLGQSGTITLDLSNANGVDLLDDIMSNGFLDVIVQDDSEIDCATLNLEYCCIEIGGVKAVGNKGGFAVGGFNPA